MSWVAVVGVGAIGGLLAAELIAAGNDVVLCARSPLERLAVDVALSSIKETSLLPVAPVDEEEDE